MSGGIPERIRRLEEEIKSLNERLNDARNSAATHNILSTTHPDTDSAGSPSNGDIILRSGGLWTFSSSLPEEAIPQYEDNFNDASRHWSWFDFPGNGLITEVGDVLTLSSNGAHCDMWGAGGTAPVAVVGIAHHPLTIEAKLSNLTLGDHCTCGIYIAPEIDGALGFGLERSRDDTVPRNGVDVIDMGTVSLASVTPLTNDPIWLRIMQTGVGQDAKLYFYYSTDGVIWNLITTRTSNCGLNQVAGIYCRNWNPWNQVNGDFEYFKVSRSYGAG